MGPTKDYQFFLSISFVFFYLFIFHFTRIWSNFEAILSFLWRTEVDDKNRRLDGLKDVLCGSVSGFPPTSICVFSSSSTLLPLLNVKCLLCSGLRRLFVFYFFRWTDMIPRICYLCLRQRGLQSQRRCVKSEEGRSGVRPWRSRLPQFDVRPVHRDHLRNVVHWSIVGVSQWGAIRWVVLYGNKTCV